MIRKRFYKIIKMENDWRVKVYRTRAGGQTGDPDQAVEYTEADYEQWGKRDGWKMERV